MGKSVFLIAAVITTLVFVGVFLLVKMDESAKFEALSEEIMLLYEEQQANKIIQSYFETSTEKSCELYERQISRQLNHIYSLFEQLEQLENTTFATPAGKVKRQYLLTSMSLWIDLRDASKSCDMEIKPVLYFFPERWKRGQPQSCVECDAMVQQLEALKADCPNVRVFAFPAESAYFEFVDLLKSDYGVTQAPAIVVEGHVLYTIISTQQLREWLAC